MSRELADHLILIEGAMKSSANLQLRNLITIFAVLTSRKEILTSDRSHSIENLLANGFDI